MALSFVMYQAANVNDDDATVIARRVPVCADTAPLLWCEHTVEQEPRTNHTNFPMFTTYATSLVSQVIRLLSPPPIDERQSISSVCYDFARRTAGT